MVSTAPSVAARLPWYCLVLVFGAACIPIGVLWDISWHEAIGRDTFWTPAHMVTYLGGLVPGLTCGWLALKTHFFGTPEERAASVSLWGFRAPLGAWVTIWGSFTMVLSAPFDNWWHDAYGLDVKILSPPHTVLALGMLGVAAGVLLLMASLQNRAVAGDHVVGLPFIFMCGVMLTMVAIFLTEKSFPNQQRSREFYWAACLTYPMYLAAAARGSKRRWPATTAALVYAGIVLTLLWVLPLFAAEPKLAPVYRKIDRMVPPPFPLLLVVPALAMDLSVRFFGKQRGFWRDTLLAVPLGLLFFGLLLLTQWYFAEFLLSQRADNWFFAGGQSFPYSSKPGSWEHEFWHTRGRNSDTTSLTWAAVWIAVGLSILKARLGLGLGNWLSRIRR